MCFLLDFFFVIVVEEMLVGVLFCEYKFQGGFFGGVWDVGQEVEYSGYVIDYQLGKYYY